MSRGKLLAIFGSIVALSASIGLMRFGPVVVRALEILTWRVDRPVEGLLGELLYLAIAAAVYCAGVMIHLAGSVAHCRSQAITRRGRMLFYVAGAAGVVCGVAMLVGAWWSKSGLDAVVAAVATPQAGDLAAFVAGGVTAMKFAFASLILGELLLCVAAFNAFDLDPPRDEAARWLPGLVVAAGVASGLFAGVCVVNWWLHGRALIELWSQLHVAPQASHIVRHLSAIFISTLLAGPCLMIVGASRVVVGWQARESRLGL